MDEKRMNELEDLIYGWYWARNGPSPALAFALMSRFIRRAEPRACTREGAALKRGQYRFVSKELESLMHIGTQTMRTLISVLSNHKLIIKQHQSNKRATIITVCNYNSYWQCKNKSNSNPTAIQHQSNMTPTNYIGTRDNINNINNIKGLDNAYLDSQWRAGARTRGGGRSSGVGRSKVDGRAPIDDEIDVIANDGAWIAAVAEYHGINANAVVRWLGIWRSFCKADSKQSKGHGGDLDECKSHFNAWLKKQIAVQPSGKAQRNAEATAGRKQKTDADVPSWESREEYEKAAEAWAKAH